MRYWSPAARNNDVATRDRPLTEPPTRPPEAEPPTIAALLPLKAHSERVPGKNFRAFHGKPLFRVRPAG